MAVVVEAEEAVALALPSEAQGRSSQAQPVTATQAQVQAQPQAYEQPQQPRRAGPLQAVAVDQRRGQQMGPGEDEPVAATCQGLTLGRHAQVPAQAQAR